MKNNNQFKKTIKTVALQSRPEKSLWWKRASLMVIIIIIAGAALLWTFRGNPSHFEFIMKPVLEPEKILEVSLKIKNPHPDGNIYSLYKGEIEPYDLSCEDVHGKKLEIIETDDIINIVITNKSKFIKLLYRIKIAQLGKHGYRGQYYDDLLTFDGEQTLLFPPLIASGDDQAIKKSMGRITIKTMIPADWVSVIPFAKKTLFPTDNLSTELTVPNWSRIYDLTKSSYTFGKLIKHPCPGENLFSIYVDPAAQQFYNNETLMGLKSIYGYYSKLFGFKIPFSLVLLRKNPGTGQYLIGGSSAQTLATTFDPAKPRDWQLMGHRFFHAFFDHKITSSKFHFPPELWFYEGLATYYENMSMTELPDTLSKKLDLDLSHSFLELFRRYLYMRIKDPHLLAFAPMSEETIDSPGQIEFLHYTQAPLIIKYLDDLSFLDTGIRDRALKFILYNNPEDFSLQSVFQFTLGKKTSDFAGQYLFGTDILPLWYLSGAFSEDSNQVIKELNNFEYTLWTWFRLENSSYQQDHLKLDGLAAQAEVAEKAGLKFADADTEAQVKQISSTVYRLLKQYALRAKKAHVDFNDPQLRFKVAGKY